MRAFGRGALAACVGLLGLAALPACSAWRTGESGLGTDHIRVPHDKLKAAQVDCIA